MKFIPILAFAITVGSSIKHVNADVPVLPGSSKLSKKAQLGQQLFFDTELSEPAGLACSSCHNPTTAFTDADKTQPTSKGADTTLHGNRNTPTAMYSGYAPAFYYDRASGLYMGGQFVDGRAATLSDQAKGPFLNPLEMANPDAASVVDKVKNADYAAMFDSVYGTGALDDTTLAYNRIADAIASFERSPVLNRFTSKYDFYLFGKAKFTAAEVRGRKVFESANKGNCAACHPSRPSLTGAPPLLTDHSYDNLGIPKNPENPYYNLVGEYNPDGADFVDLGLGGRLNQLGEDGKFKVPTLRNITITSPYMHNGYFKTLRGVIEFYNNRDIKRRCSTPMTTETIALSQKCWPAPEAAVNVNHTELGALKLSAQDISDLIAFLNTLTDGYKTESPWPYHPPE